MKVTKVLMLVWLGLLFVSVICSAAPNYTITNLGTFGGEWSIANDINNNGDVVGYWFSSTPYHFYEQHAFLWKNNQCFDLGCGEALAINSFGDIVGWSPNQNSPDITDACVWKNGNKTLLEKGAASDINDAGQVVGWNGQGACLWQGGQRIDLLPLHRNSCASGINENGRIVGTDYYWGGQSWIRSAFLWKSSLNIETLASPSIALRVNNSDQAVGYKDISEQSFLYSRPFLWSDGVVQDIGTFGGPYGQAQGINNLSQIVGWADTLNNQSHAFIWQNDKMEDLNNLIPTNLGWLLDRATAINDKGQIVGYGRINNGAQRAFLLTPVAEPLPPRFYAVLVGVADGRSTRGDKDAIVIYNVLSKYPGIKAENLWLVINPKDEEDVHIILEKIVEKLRPRDQLMFYYAGHGSYWNDGTEPEIINSPRIQKETGDYTNTGDEFLALTSEPKSWISDDVLTNWLSSNPKMADVQKLVILDSCMSGGFWGQSGNENDIGDLDKLQNIGLIAACGEGQVAYGYPDSFLLGEKAGRGRFSWQLEKALTLGDDGIAPADLNKDGMVSFEELCEALQRGYIFEEGEVGVIRDFPWLEEDIEVKIDALELYTVLGTGFDQSAPIVPEPGTLILLNLGWLFLLIFQKKRA